MQRLIENAGRLLRRGYPLVFAFVFLGYIGLAALPPVLMHNGAEAPAKLICTVYGYCCHQLPYRSFFFFGKQPYYPLEAAGIAGVQSYESLGIPGSPRKFLGNETVGWKMAVCERDAALWATMGLFCILFFIRGRSMRRIRLHTVLLFGVLPMALDGGTQVLSRILKTPRESTPLIRVITGALFGFFVCRFLFPALEESIRYGGQDDRS